jgi:hypothetical protein
VASAAQREDLRVVGCSLNAPATTPLTNASVTVRAVCEEDVTYSAEAVVAAPFVRGSKVQTGARRFTLRRIKTQTITAGHTARITLVLPPAVIEAATRGLNVGRRTSVRVKVTATDAAGNTRTNAVTVRLR